MSAIKINQVARRGATRRRNPTRLGSEANCIAKTLIEFRRPQSALMGDSLTRSLARPLARSLVRPTACLVYCFLCKCCSPPEAQTRPRARFVSAVDLNAHQWPRIVSHPLACSAMGPPSVANAPVESAPAARGRASDLDRVAHD